MEGFEPEARWAGDTKSGPVVATDRDGKETDELRRDRRARRNLMRLQQSWPLGGGRYPLRSAARSSAAALGVRALRLGTVGHCLAHAANRGFDHGRARHPRWAIAEGGQKKSTDKS